MISTIDKVAGNAYDYVIIGGGTAGLVLASRLSEDNNVSILVLEAGPDHTNDKLIAMPGNFGRKFMNPQYDYSFMTVPQKNSDNTPFYWPRGKGLGGSSAMNFYVWNKPPAEDVNAVEELGNPGWNWDRFHEYSKKAETFHPPSREMAVSQQLANHLHDYGQHGPIETGFMNVQSGWDSLLLDTLKTMKVKPAEAPFGGRVNGTYFSPSTISPITHERSSSLDYLKRINDRTNITILTHATVSRILSTEDKDADGNIVATGVEFYYDGKKYSVEARKDVLLCAGAIQSPQILELSGIGDTAILSKIGVETKVHLPGVGTNVQEHLICGLSFELKEQDKFLSLDPLNDPAIFEENLKLYPQGEGLLLLAPITFCVLPLETLTPAAASIIAAQETRFQNELESGKLSPGLKRQYEIQMRNLKAGAGGLELAAAPAFVSRPNPPEKGKKYVSMHGGIYHPWSRGTIHATSTDPFQHPEIDPHYFEEDIDLITLLELMKFIRRVASQQPWSSCLGKEINPGPEVQSDDELKQWIKTTSSTTFHTAGSCSMLPREENGVVDSRLKVYGTTNVRVVDLSVLPLHIASHTQAWVYGLAEQAADVIKGVI
ncbi:GMC oxidoreductase [Dentipellis sp. KUC8613]|nr:GMC oxidoreductase [Dentipellis sp. KUC8613]